MHSNVTKNFQNKTFTQCPLFPGQQHFLPHIFNQCLYSIKQMQDEVERILLSVEWGSVLLLARDEVEEGQTSEQKVKGQRKTLQLLRSLSRHLPSRVERTETHTQTHTRREREKHSLANHRSLLVS